MSEVTPWGEFGGRCLVGGTRFAADVVTPGASAFGLRKTWSALLGTWRDARGITHRVLRVVDGFDTKSVTYFSSSGGRLERHEESNALHAGAVLFTRDGERVRMSSPEAATASFEYEWTTAGSSWREGSLLDVRGDPLAPAHHWYHPWPGRGGLGAYVISEKSLAEGTVAGEPMRGVFTHEVHFFPPGYDWFASPYGAGGMEITWGHFVTELSDGEVIDADLAFGRDGWGFAMVREGDAPLVTTTDVRVDADVRANGYPTEIRYDVCGEKWVWHIAPDGERGAPSGDRSSMIIGAEGVLTRADERRSVVRAMGTIDWWIDGRAESIVRAR